VLETTVRIAKVLKVDRVLKLLRLYQMAVTIVNRVAAWQSDWQWERRAKRLYSQFIRSGDLVFDVGANRGTRVGVFRKLGATVVAVEPQQHCVDTLRRRFNRHVFVEQLALGSTEGEAEMMIQDDADVASTLSEEFIGATKKYGMAETSKWNWNRKITVKTNTLNNLISKYGCPSFCKIDVEGYEYEVLMGLSKPVAALSIEFHPLLFEMFTRNINRLKALGFTEYNYSMGESMQLALPHWVTDEEIISIVSSLPRDMSHGDIYARRGRE
jgi:FkbM family methyltransferase